MYSGKASERNGNGTMAENDNKNGVHKNGSNGDFIGYPEESGDNPPAKNGSNGTTKGSVETRFEEELQPVAVDSPNNRNVDTHVTSYSLHVYDPEDDVLNQSFSDEEENADLDSAQAQEGDTKSDGPILSVFGSGSKKSPLKVYKPAKTTEKKPPGMTNAAGGGDKLDAKPRIYSRSGVPITSAPEDFMTSYFYCMKYPHRGYAFIINNTTFTMDNTPYRSGSDRDAAALQKSLLRLGFEVETFENLTVAQMRAAMRYYSGEDEGKLSHLDRDCFLCAIFSHGEEGVIYGTDGKIALGDLTAPFRGDRCLSLAGKPKIFIVQACRGEKLDSGVDLVEADAPCTYRVPAEADFLYAFATASGYFAWRNTQQGSWFIQALCSQLDEHAYDPGMDFLKLLTRVNYEVAFAHESNVPSDPKWHRKKQIPSIVTMLTKDLVFAPKGQLKMDTDVGT